MSHTKGHLIAIVLGVVLIAIAQADILVNIQVNKPIHDVNEQFVSFSVPPELLYETLDGPNKKTLTDMASLLGPSYLRLAGDYFFPTDLKSSLKNPTQSIWSGFNRWTRAMNWTMVIPVQYTPLSWDPIDALRVLNISNTVGIDNCIWQLGLDFGPSAAEDYVADLNTLDTMVDTFRPYVKSWRIIGADVTAGSSAEETKQYIDMSKDVNTAYGWTQPAGYHVEENLNGFVYDKDLSLKAMIEKKVPIWLSVPQNMPAQQMSNTYASVEITEAIRLAQTLGDAASSGIDAVFKPLTKDDISTPNYSFFVAALFKKIMGNRIFPAKIVKRVPYVTKLYTHCANGISGGIAFMGVNTEDYPVKISARLNAKFTGSEVWQFVLTTRKGAVMLNNEELTLNSTLEPLVRIKHPNKPLAITLPPMSVGFWVLPLANNEDCQFTELLSTFTPEAHWEIRPRKQSSSDRLLKKLILETSLTDQMKNRRRRDISANALNKDATSSDDSLVSRQRRFILRDKTPPRPSLPQERNLKKREDATNWLKSLVLNPVAIPKVEWGLRRNRRAVDFFNTLFAKENAAANRAPSRRQMAPSTRRRYEDEARLFKKFNGDGESEVPVGDVHFQYITGADGEEIKDRLSKEEFEQEDVRFTSNRELPSEFYESFSPDKYPIKTTQNKIQPKSKKSEISGISGQTMYMTRNQLEPQLEELQREFREPLSSVSSDDRDKLRTIFGTDLGYPRPHSLDKDKMKSVFGTEFITPTARKTIDLQKYMYESEETDALKSYLKTAKTSSPSSTRRRGARSIDYGKLKHWHDNLITKDEYIKPLSYIIPEMSESNYEEPEMEMDTKVSVANIKNRVTRILSVVKNHLSGFFNSLVN